MQTQKEYTILVSYTEKLTGKQVEHKFGPFDSREKATFCASVYLWTFPNDTIVIVKETVDNYATKQPK